MVSTAKSLELSPLISGEPQTFNKVFVEALGMSLIDLSNKLT
jgi:hypothetical protein